jgi:hypothetical protein
LQQHVMRVPKPSRVTREAVDAASAKIGDASRLWGSPAKEFAAFQYATLERRYWRQTAVKHVLLPAINPVEQEFLSQAKLWESRAQAAADLAASALAESWAGSA